MPRSVVIAGGGTGIGRACAAHFVASGDSVFITGRRAELLQDVAVSVGVVPVAFDASDPHAVAGALDKLPDRIDVLVNNAGGNTNLAPSEVPEMGGATTTAGHLLKIASQWRANRNANLMTAILVTEAPQDRLVDNARIVSIGSIAGRTGGGGSYGAAKAALEAWTADVACSLGPRHITANVVSLGLIEETEFFHGKLSDERRAVLTEATFTKRAGQPEDFVAAVAFLASPNAGHVTGQVIPVNGGAQLAR